MTKQQNQNIAPAPTTQQNPNLKNIDRAAYELGHLLQALPHDFSGRLPATPDVLLIAEAAARHASNASDTIMSGLEAIGAYLFSAGLNTDFPVDGSHAGYMGALIQHLAVEAQFMQEKERELEYALRKHGKVEP
jgi:hypothetical protein